MSKLTSTQDIVASKKDYQSVPENDNKKIEGSEDEHHEHRVF